MDKLHENALVLIASNPDKERDGGKPARKK